jgi:hypothetical protein
MGFCFRWITKVDLELEWMDPENPPIQLYRSRRYKENCFRFLQWETVQNQIGAKSALHQDHDFTCLDRRSKTPFTRVEIKWSFVER